MTRTCPNCQSKLGSYDHYFCTSCGAQLPPELVKGDISFVQVTRLKESPKINLDLRTSLRVFAQRFRDFKGKKIVLGIGVFAVLVVIGLVYLIRSSDPFATGLRQTEDTAYVVANRGIFGARVIADYVPHDVDIYIETKDYDVLADLFLEVDESYFKLVRDLEQVVSPHAGFFISDVTTAPALSVIVFPREDDFDATSLDLAEYEWLTAEMVDTALVISPQKDLIREIQKAKGGLIKSLAKTSHFVTYAQKEIEEGTIMIYTSTPELKPVFVHLLSKSPSEKLVEVLKKYDETQSEFVIM